MSGVNNGLLSICCLGYCHARYISDAINSISAINYSRIEVIAVDDGSTDDSVELLQSLSASVPFTMNVVAQKNTGNIGLNFNNAYKLATGDLIAFISLDDVYNSTVMLQQIQAMNADSTLAFIASSKTVSINDEGYVTNKADQISLFEQDDSSPEMMLELEYSEFGSFYAQSAIFRKDVIDAVGGFDEDMTGDDIVLRTKVLRYLACNPQYKFKILKECSFFYRLHRENIHKNLARQMKIVTEYLDRYWPDRDTPELLFDWVYAYVSDNKFEECVSLFSINARTAKMLSSARVVSGLSLSLKKEVAPWSRFGKFIYSRTKLGSEKRRVVLFGYFSFEYKRIKNFKKSKRGESYKHYTEYNKAS